MILLPRPEINFETNINVGIKGYLRLQCINKFSGKITQDTGWFPNTILDAGRNVMADDSLWMNCCQVGTDGTAPNQSQTALLGYIDGTSDIQTTTSGTQGTEPYYGWKRRTYRIQPGAIGGQNLSEAGIGWATSGSTLISRARILDPILQTPTTITPLADEILDVTYELRYYPPLVDVTSPQVVLDGVTYNTITRAAAVTDSEWSSGIGTKIGIDRGLIDFDWKAYDGDIGTLLTLPSGLSTNWIGGTMYNSAYQNNSYQVVINAECISTGWNVAAGIRSIHIRTTAGSYQTQFNAVGTGNPIPKDLTYNMTMRWTIGWTEKV